MHIFSLWFILIPFPCIIYPKLQDGRIYVDACWLTSMHVVTSVDELFGGSTSVMRKMSLSNSTYHMHGPPAETFCKLMHAYAPFRGCPRTAESGYNETYSVHLFVLWPLSLNMQPFCLCQLPPPSLAALSLSALFHDRPSLFPLYLPSISTHDVYLRRRRRTY